MMQMLDPIVHYAREKKNKPTLHKSVIFFLLICHETLIQIMAAERAVPEQFEESSINSFNVKGASLAAYFYLIFWSQQSDCGWIVRKNGIWKKVHMINQPEFKERHKCFEISSQKSLQIL